MLHVIRYFDDNSFLDMDTLISYTLSWNNEHFFSVRKRKIFFITKFNFIHFLILPLKICSEEEINFAFYYCLI